MINYHILSCSQSHQHPSYTPLPILRCVMQKSESKMLSHQKSNDDDWSEAVKTSLEKLA